MKVTIYNIGNGDRVVGIFYTKREALKAIQHLKKGDEREWLMLKEEIGEDLEECDPTEYFIEKEVLEGNTKSVVRQLIVTGITYAGGTVDSDELCQWHAY